MIKELTIIDTDNDSQEVQMLLPMKLKNLECKHIPYIDNSTQNLHQNSLDIGYDNDIFGSHRKYTDIFDELERIHNMAQTPCLRAVRIVISQDGRVWSDNTHWTISYLIRYGIDTRLREIPFYVIDFRTEIPTILNHLSTLFDSVTEIKKALIAGKNIQERLNIGWRKNDLTYTIEDLTMALGGMEIEKRDV